MKLAIVGSPKISQVQYKVAEFTIIGLAWGYLLKPNGVLVSGGASGIDSLAEFIAVNLDIETKIFYPNNHRWEPDGFKDRNMQIAEYCDKLVAIRSRSSLTYGSGWTADYAEKIGKEVHRLWI